jgi:YfiH family protein
MSGCAPWEPRCSASMIEVPVALGEGSAPRLELAEWREQFGVIAGITGAGPGPAPFDLGLGGTTPVATVLEHWRSLQRSLPDFSAVIVARQVHGSEILWHQTARGLVIRESADGHATATPGLLLAVTAADCIPIYLCDPERRLIALLHAGWRGVAAGILARGLELLAARGASVDKLLVHCGVGICGFCYEVGSEVLAACGVAPPKGGRGPLDLRGVLAAQAANIGVERVSTSPLCSRHDPGFLSHRGSGGADGRMVAYLGLLS